MRRKGPGLKDKQPKAAMSSKSPSRAEKAETKISQNSLIHQSPSANTNTREDMDDPNPPDLVAEPSSLKTSSNEMSAEADTQLERSRAIVMLATGSSVKPTVEEWAQCLAEDDFVRRMTLCWLRSHSGLEAELHQQHQVMANNEANETSVRVAKEKAAAIDKELNRIPEEVSESEDSDHQQISRPQQLDEKQVDDKQANEPVANGHFNLSLVLFVVSSIATVILAFQWFFSWKINERN
jgi:hypothetical protein